MKNILFCLFVVCGFIACQDIPEGYLIVEDAGYNPDSLVVKAKLDLDSSLIRNEIWDDILDDYFTEEVLNGMGIYEYIKAPGPDADRDRLDIPWVSTAIQGVEGTNPIFITITRITSEDGDPEKLMECITVRNNGMFSVPCHHEIPVGYYHISLNCEGPGHSERLDDVFTIVVK